MTSSHSTQATGTDTTNTPTLSQQPQEIALTHQNTEKDMGSQTRMPRVASFYSTNLPPTKLEARFGEPHHIKDHKRRITKDFLWTVALVYVIQGAIQWMPFMNRYFFIKHLDNKYAQPAVMQRMMAVMAIPWIIKIVYGLFVDGVRIGGYRRKSYLIIFGCWGTLWIGLAMIPNVFWTLGGQIFCFLNVSLSMAFGDVVADAVTVERTEGKSQVVAGKLQAFQFGIRGVSQVVGLIVAAEIQRVSDPVVSYGFFALLFTGMAVAGIVYKEQSPKAAEEPSSNTDDTQQPHTEQSAGNRRSYIHVNSWAKSKALLKLTGLTVLRKPIFYPALFLLILRSTPTTEEALQFFMIYELGFSVREVAYVMVAATLSFFVAIAIFVRFSNRNKLNTRLALLVTALFAAFLPCITLIAIFRLNRKAGIPDILFMIGDSFVVNVASELILMICLVISARLCPPGIEGLLFSVFMMILTLARILSLQLGSAFIDIFNIHCENVDLNDNLVASKNSNCNFSNLWILVVVANASTLIPLLFLKWVPTQRELDHVAAQIMADQYLDENRTALDQSLSDINKSISFIREEDLTCCGRCCLRRCCRVETTQSQMELREAIDL